MKQTNYYLATIGCRALHWYGGDDRHARQVVARWIGIFWERYSSEDRGSIAHAINNRKPGIRIGRKRLTSSGVVPCTPFAMVESLPEWSGEPVRYERGMIIVEV